MKRRQMNGIVLSMVVTLFASSANAQSGEGDVYWHVDPSVKTCSMIIDPALTQSQWHTFTQQAGAVMTFRPLASASTLGKLNLRVGIDDFRTPVNQHDPAWINTFAHPDADCPLGDAITFPSIRASIGVSDRLDLGGFWTTAPDANYGVAGAELKYAIVHEAPHAPALAVRLAASWLTGAPDFNLGIYGLELMASKRVTVVTPYLGIRETLSVGTETTSKVDLHTENVASTQGYAGMATYIWKLHLAAEYDIASVSTFALSLGVGF